MALSNTQYNTLIRRYEERQLENQHTVSARTEALYRQVPRLSQIDSAISSASLAQARRLINGEDEALGELKRQIAALHEEKERLLCSLGYPADYLSPPYGCKDCRDTGYIGNKKCHCFQQAAIDLVYTQSNIRQILEKENFQHFSEQYYSGSQVNPATGLSSLATAQKAVALCMDFIETFDHAFKNLFFYGDTGTGKTFLSNCVAKELLDTGHSVIYFSASSLFHIFEKNDFGKGGAPNVDYQNIFGCDLLIIDDLGTELPNSFTASRLFLCLNERILRQKSTIISTNLGLRQLVDTYSERTFSRISSNYAMIKLFGDDIRLQKKLNAQGA